MGWGTLARSHEATRRTQHRDDGLPPPRPLPVALAGGRGGAGATGDGIMAALRPESSRRIWAGHSICVGPVNPAPPTNLRGTHADAPAPPSHLPPRRRRPRRLESSRHAKAARGTPRVRAAQRALPLGQSPLFHSTRAHTKIFTDCSTRELFDALTLGKPPVRHITLSCVHTDAWWRRPLRRLQARRPRRRRPRRRRPRHHRSRQEARG